MSCRLQTQHEPALLTVEMVNENSLLEAWCKGRLEGRDDPSPSTWSPIPVSYANELTERYNAWLKAHCSTEDLAAIRKEANVPSNALVPRLAPDEFKRASALRFHSEAEFLMNVESNDFAG